MDTYKKLCTEFYDLTMPVPHENSMAIYLPAAQQAKGPVLEPMCGSGRYLLAMLEQGIDIDGMDASKDMLASCRARCNERGFNPTLRQQFLHELDFPRKYGFAFIPASSISLITAENQVREGLRRIYDHLVPGGLFYVEIETPKAQPTTSGTWEGRWVDRPDGARIVLSSLDQYDDEDQISRSLGRYELFKDGHLIETALECLEIRYYDPAAFRTLLEEAGFQHLTAYNRYTRRAAVAEDAEIYFTASKP